MKFDINRLLDIDYLNDLASKFNIEIMELSSSYLELYTLDMFNNISLDNVNEIFNKYNVDNSNIIQYFESDFIDGDWEFADLFSDDITYSSELKESIKNKALAEVEELNSKIDEINLSIKEKIQEIKKDLDIIDLFLRVLNSNEVVYETDVNEIFMLVSECECSDEEKFVFSGNIARKLIAKNKELSLKADTVDTSDFEKSLDDIYETSEVNEEDNVDVMLETTYSETIIGYYKFYKDLLETVGINSLDQIINDSISAIDNINPSLHSMERIDFCLALGSLLSTLHNYESSEDKYQEALQDLSILDRIYEEDEKNSKLKSELINKVKENLNIISTMPSDSVNNSFVGSIISVLNQLRVELNDNLIDSAGMKKIKSSYDKVSLKINKIPVIIKMLNILENFKNKILSLLQSCYLLKEDYSMEFYENISSLQDNILGLIDDIKANGYDTSYEERCNDIASKFNEYNIQTKEDTAENETTKLSGFVLFDFDESLKPYILSDLDLKSKNNLIDSSISQSMVNSGYEDVNKLVNDLLIYGKPEILLENSQNYYASRIIDRVYYDGEARNHTTGIVRIRPLRNSCIRFTSKEFLLKSNTEMHKQVIGLLREILPNVCIDQDNDFSLFVNFSVAMKRQDKTSYNETIRRYDRKSFLFNLFFANSDRKSFNDEELSLLKDIINVTLDTYMELEKCNDRMRFDIIHKIGGKRSHGQ